MLINPISNQVSFGSMGKLAYQTSKTIQKGLPFYTTKITRGGKPIAEITRCKVTGHEALFGYKQKGQKTLFFQSFTDILSGKHAMSIRYKNMAQNRAVNEPVAVKYSIPWKVNNKKAPSFRDFYKMSNLMEKLTKLAKDCSSEVL